MAPSSPGARSDTSTPRLTARLHSLVKPTDLSKVGLAFFTVNGIISVLLGALGIIDVFL